MPGTTSSESTRPTQHTHHAFLSFRWWLTAFALGFATIARFVAIAGAPRSARWHDTLTLIGIISFSTLTIALAGSSAMRFLWRRRVEIQPSDLRVRNGWLAGGHGAIRWLAVGGVVIFLAAAAGLCSAIASGTVHRIATGIAMAGLISLLVLAAGLVVWLIIALAIQLRREPGGPPVPAYPGGPEVPAEPWAYMSQKWGSPRQTLISGTFLVAVGTGLLSVLSTNNDDGFSAFMTSPLTLGLVGGGLFMVWTGIRRGQWASRFKTTVGCSPWSDEIVQLRARGSGHDTADL